METMAAVFSLEGVEDTSEAHEAAWNGWVDTLRVLGVEPEGFATTYTEHTATFRLRRLDPAADFLAGEKAKVSA